MICQTCQALFLARNHLNFTSPDTGFGACARSGPELYFGSRVFCVVPDVPRSGRKVASHFISTYQPMWDLRCVSNFRTTAELPWSTCCFLKPEDWEGQPADYRFSQEGELMSDRQRWETWRGNRENCEKHRCTCWFHHVLYVFFFKCF